MWWSWQQLHHPTVRYNILPNPWQQMWYECDMSITSGYAPSQNSSASPHAYYCWQTSASSIMACQPVTCSSSCLGGETSALIYNGHFVAPLSAYPEYVPVYSDRSYILGSTGWLWRPGFLLLLLWFQQCLWPAHLTLTLAVLPLQWLP